MADLRISDLPEALNIQEKDLIAISQDDGDGTFTSKKIEAQNFDIIAGIRYYGQREDDPVFPTPNDGDKYYNSTLNADMLFDGPRGKWLTQNTVVLYFGRSGNTATGVFYRTPSDGLAFSATNGYFTSDAGTIVALGWTRNDSDNTTLEVTEDGITIASVISAATTGDDKSLNGDFDASSVIGVRNGDNPGDNTTNSVAGWIAIKLRSDASPSSSSSFDSSSSSSF